MMPSQCLGFLGTIYFAKERAILMNEKLPTLRGSNRFGLCKFRPHPPNALILMTDLFLTSSDRPHSVDHERCGQAVGRLGVYFGAPHQVSAISISDCTLIKWRKPC